MPKGPTDKYGRPLKPATGSIFTPGARIYDPLHPYNDKWGRPPGSRDYGKKPPSNRNPKLPGNAANDAVPTMNGTAGGGGGGGGADPGLSPYIQYYREHYFPGGKPPDALLKNAKDNNWSISYFAQRVRLQDPHYLASREARILLPNFTRAMKTLFPGLADKTKAAALMKSPFYRRAAVWYLRQGVGLSSGGGLEALYGHVTNTARWNKANPYWKSYITNKNVNVQGEADPLVYKELLQTLRQSFTDAGMTVPEDYYKSFFRSRYASSEGMKGLSQNLSDLVQKGGSFGWMEGKNLTPTQTKSVLFGSKLPATDLRSRLAKSFALRGSFLSGETSGADSALSRQGKLIKPLL